MDSRSLWIGALCLSLPLVPGAALGIAVEPAGLHAVLHGDSAYLGVNLENLTDQQRAELGVGPNVGVVIAAVDHDAPAGKAGLRSNDVITKLNGKTVQQAHDLQRLLAAMMPGQTVTLDILRHGQPIQVNVVLANRKTVEQRAWSEHYLVPDPHVRPTQKAELSVAAPSEAGAAPGGNAEPRPGPRNLVPYTGIDLERMSLQLSRYFGIANSTGLLARSIDPNSPGSKAGLKAGDVICQANNLPMTSRDGWNDMLRENRGQTIRLKILRNHHSRMVRLVLSSGHN